MPEPFPKYDVQLWDERGQQWCVIASNRPRADADEVVRAEIRDDKRMGWGEFSYRVVPAGTARH